jgi:hypothetical protein
MSTGKALALAFALVVTPMTVAAQMWMNKTDQLGANANGSPRVRTEWTIDTATVSLAYSRPSLKGRPLDAVVQPNVPWKASDDEPATISSTKPLIFANVTVPPGTYSLWVLPQGEAWTLIINKQAGAVKAYEQGQDVGRISMRVDKLPKPVDQQMMTIEPSSDRVSGGVQVRIDFGNVKAVCPFVIKR